MNTPVLTAQRPKHRPLAELPASTCCSPHRGGNSPDFQFHRFILPGLEFDISVMIESVLLCVWLLSLSITSVRFIHVPARNNLFSLLCSIPLHGKLHCINSIEKIPLYEYITMFCCCCCLTDAGYLDGSINVVLNQRPCTEVSSSGDQPSFLWVYTQEWNCQVRGWACST